MITQSFYTLTNIDFIILIDFAWSTTKKYDDHPYHPNIGSSPPPLPGHYLGSCAYWALIFDHESLHWVGTALHSHSRLTTNSHALSSTLRCSHQLWICSKLSWWGCSSHRDTFVERLLSTLILVWACAWKLNKKKASKSNHSTLVQLMFVGPAFKNHTNLFQRHCTRRKPRGRHF